MGGARGRAYTIDSGIWWLRWCGGVASVVRICGGGDGSDCHGDAGGDDGGGFGYGRSWPEVA
ncbi:hypothetical protein Tco_0674040, partial [Tanacetum coccineum]